MQPYAYNLLFLISLFAFMMVASAAFVVDNLQKASQAICKRLLSLINWVMWAAEIASAIAATAVCYVDFWETNLSFGWYIASWGQLVVWAAMHHLLFAPTIKARPA